MVPSDKLNDNRQCHLVLVLVLVLVDSNLFQIRNRPTTRLGVGTPRGTPLIILSIVTGGHLVDLGTKSWGVERRT